MLYQKVHCASIYEIGKQTKVNFLRKDFIVPPDPGSVKEPSKPKLVSCDCNDLPLVKEETFSKYIVNNNRLHWLYEIA